MSITRTYEDQCLDRVRRILVREIAAANGKDGEIAHLDALEGAASAIGGFDLRTFRKRFRADHVLSEKRATQLGKLVATAVQALPVDSALALSALARPRLDHSAQRSAGVYHTDFRLARYVAEALGDSLVPQSRIIDPACGSGILLVATTLQALKNRRATAASWLASNVYAADLSEQSLRGARLALASLTDSIDAVSDMNSHFRIGDSLLSDPKQIDLNEGFDVVVGNPPWEKIKATRH